MVIKENLSKYKVKGTGFLNLKKFVDKHIDAAVFEEEIIKLSPQYANVLLPSTWYEAFDFKLLSEIFAHKMSISLEQFCLELNAFNTENDLNGIYRFFLKLGGPLMILKATPQFVRTYTNTLDYVVLVNQVGIHKGVMNGPDYFSTWNQYMVHGGAKGILKAIGKK